MIRIESLKQRYGVGRVDRTGISSTCSMLAGGRWRRALAFNVLFLASGAVGAQTMRVADIADLSLEEPGNIQITSGSKQAERLAAAARSIFLVTRAGLPPPRG